MNIKHAIAAFACLFSILHVSAQDFKVSKTDDNKVEITYNTKRNFEKGGTIRFYQRRTKSIKARLL